MRSCVRERLCFHHMTAPLAVHQQEIAMIARFKPLPSEEARPEWHELFLKMLPTIKRYASLAFRDRNPEAKEDLTEEVVVNAMLAFKRLYNKDRVDDAHATVLARYAIAQVCEGRKTGSPLKCREVLSDYAQRKKGFYVDRLDHYDEEEQAWSEVVVEDRTAGPADIAATRIDFRAWLGTLSRQQKKAATKLAAGETTGKVAKLLKVSSGRISQLRRELLDKWREFQGEDPLDRTVGDAA